ncbi:penicillin binding protein PBP4B [Georgenia faecalis]|uniref:Penicillin binding protein PBP4B n=1 Tax=Georgenia faecalis TaxID=2483799 RepID=A0ABV9DCP7_9MICO|nr:penicillin binding protein PBP4B [Georgenia faecalis]
MTTFRPARAAAAAAGAALLLAMVPAPAVLADVAVPGADAQAGASTLTVHYYKPGSQYESGIEAAALGGAEGTLTDVDADGFGTTMTFSFPEEEPDAYLGFTVTEDSTFPDDTRYVRAVDGAAEVWVVDGDPRAYDEPTRIDPEVVVKRDAKAYVAVEDLTELLDLTYTYGSNGYLFDGAAPGTLDVLTIHRGRDYFEIAVDRDRIGSNVTGNMLNEYTDLVFDDVDGFRQGGRYYLSFGAIERLFQVRPLVLDGAEYLLEKQFVAHDEITPADPGDVGFDPARLAELDDYINAQVADGSSAVAVVVTKDGKVVKEDAYGYALRYSTSEVDGVTQPAELLPQSQWQPAEVDTLFDLASNTKMYATNYALQRLVSEGRLDLDRTLVSFPGWEGFTDANSVYTGKWTVGGEGGIPERYTGKETITVRDILHHHAGLIPDPEYPNLGSAGELWYQTSDHTDRSGIIERISQTPLRYAPRTTFAYSDVDYMILGLLIEQISGKPLDVYLEEEIYGPLGLDDTLFTPLEHGVAPSRIAATELNGNTRDGNVSFGAHADGTPVYIRDYTLQGEVHDEKAFYSMDGVSGHAGLFSTTSDMAVLTQLMLGGGIYGGEQYFTQEVIDEFLTPYSLDPANVDASTVALGWRVHSKSAAAYYYFNWGPSRSTFGHQGWTGTLTVIDPLHDLTITILTNMRHSPVINPPNGFEGANFPIADLAPISAHVYRALEGESQQYNPLVEIGDVEDVSVERGTPLEAALAALPAATTVVDTAGATHAAPLTWEIADYDGATPGAYAARGTFALPAGVTQAEPPVELAVDATVTVTLPEPSIALSADEVDPGADVGVSGEGFAPGERVEIRLVDGSDPTEELGDAVLLGTADVAATSELAQTVTIDAATVPGAYVVVVTGLDSERTATSALTVRPGTPTQGPTEPPTEDPTGEPTGDPGGAPGGDQGRPPAPGGGDLPRTGGAPPVWLPALGLLLAGALTLLGARRRGEAR